MMGDEQLDRAGSVGGLFAFHRGERRIDDGLVKAAVGFFVVDDQDATGIAGNCAMGLQGHRSLAFRHFPCSQKGIFDNFHRSFFTCRPGGREPAAFGLS